MAICKVCSSEFIPLNNMVKICSDDCRRAQQVKSKEKWRKGSPEARKKWAGYAQEWRDKNYLKSRYNNLKARALADNLVFDLEIEDLVIPSVCPVLGIPLDNRDRDHQWSVDKVVPAKGYTKSNTRIISMKANRLKNSASIEEIEKILEYMKKELDKK